LILFFNTQPHALTGNKNSVVAKPSWHCPPLLTN
jgi:hypothetical protein